MESTFENSPIGKAKAFNERLDADLRERGIVDQNLYLQFVSIQIDPNASSVGWLKAKLAVLASRLREGKPLHLYDCGTGAVISITNLSDLVAWAEKCFPIAEFHLDTDFQKPAQ